MDESDRPVPEPQGRPEPIESPKPIESAAPVGGDSLAVLPLRDIVVFPHMIVPLFVGREKSVRALEAVMKDDKQILLVAQKNAAQDDPSSEDIYRVGTVSTILQLLKLPDGTVKVLVEPASGRRSPAFATPTAISRRSPRRCRTRAPTPRSWRRWAARSSRSSSSTSS